MYRICVHASKPAGNNISRRGVEALAEALLNANLTVISLDLSGMTTRFSSVTSCKIKFFKGKELPFSCFAAKLLIRAMFDVSQFTTNALMEPAGNPGEVDAPFAMNAIEFCLQRNQRHACQTASSGRNSAFARQALGKQAGVNMQAGCPDATDALQLKLRQVKLLMWAAENVQC